MAGSGKQFRSVTQAGQLPAVLAPIPTAVFCLLVLLLQQPGKLHNPPSTVLVRVLYSTVRYGTVATPPRAYELPRGPTSTKPTRQNLRLVLMLILTKLYVMYGYFLMHQAAIHQGIMITVLVPYSYKSRAVWPIRPSPNSASLN